MMANRSRVDSILICSVVIWCAPCVRCRDVVSCRKTPLQDKQHKLQCLMTKTRQIGEISRHGGWRGHPNSIAALLRHQVPIAQLPKCRRCGRLAVKGYDHCVWHSGLPAPTNAAGRGESRLLRRIDYIGLLPLPLMALPAWRNLAGLPRWQRAPMRLALLLAWDKREGEPLHWARAQRQAIELGRQVPPGARREGMPWLSVA